MGEPTPLLRKAHWAIDKVTSDLGRRFAFNTAIAAVIELVNDAYRHKEELLATPEGRSQLRFATATAGSLMFPFAPHLGAEVYEMITGQRVWEEPWPDADPAEMESIYRSLETLKGLPPQHRAGELNSIKRALGPSFILKRAVVDGRTVAFRACTAVSAYSVELAAPPNSTAAARCMRSIQ